MSHHSNVVENRINLIDLAQIIKIALLNPNNNVMLGLLRVRNQRSAPPEIVHFNGQWLGSVQHRGEALEGQDNALCLMCSPSPDRCLIA